MKVAYTLDACEDCRQFVSGTNNLEPDRKQGLTEAINAKLGNPDHVRGLVDAQGVTEAGEYYHDAEGREINPEHPEYGAYCDDWFSWSPCECCGSRLGGMRNRLAVLVEDPPHASI